MPMAVERTVLSSEAHATASTVRGWTAKRHAAAAAVQTLPVALRRIRRSVIAVTAWSATLTRWKPHGSGPKAARTAIKASHVSGWK